MPLAKLHVFPGFAQRKRKRNIPSAEADGATELTRIFNYTYSSVIIASRKHNAIVPFDSNFLVGETCKIFPQCVSDLCIYKFLCQLSI